MTEEADSATSIKAHAKEWYKKMERGVSGEHTHYTTDIEPLDDLLGGIFLQRFYGVFGVPAAGKTKLATAITASLVEKHGFAADIWSTDCGAQGVIRTITSTLSGVSGTLISHAERMHESQWAKVASATKNMSEMPINIHAKGEPHIGSIVETTEVRLQELDGAPMVLFVDCCQNVTSDYTDDDAERKNLADVSRGLAALRTSHKNLVVVGVLSTKRLDESEPMPAPSDIYGSSQFEKDADHLIALHRPAQCNKIDHDIERRKGILWHAKSKHSDTGIMKVDCDLAISKFEPWSNRQS